MNPQRIQKQTPEAAHPGKTRLKDTPPQQALQPSLFDAPPVALPDASGVTGVRVVMRGTDIVRGLSAQLPLFENAGSPGAGHQAIGRLVMRSTASLRLHPEIAKLGLGPTNERILELEKHGNAIFEQPHIITQDNVIIDGHARWRIASQQKRETLLCFEIQLSQQEALQRILENHSRTDWLHPISRVELARTLRTGYRDLARANQSAGGKNKASSNLTKDQRVDSRAKLAAIARVSTGRFTNAE